MLRINRVSSMIFSFGTLWGADNISYMQQFRGEMLLPLLYCLSGDRKCKVIYKKRKSTHTSCSTLFCYIIWKPWTKRMRGEKIFLDIYHTELGAYWYFQSILRLRCTETDQQAPSQLQGHLGIAFYRMFLPAFSIAAFAGWEQGQRSWGSEKALVTRIQVLLLCTTFWTPQKINKPCWTSSLRRQ